MLQKFEEEDWDKSCFSHMYISKQCSSLFLSTS